MAEFDIIKALGSAINDGKLTDPQSGEVMVGEPLGVATAQGGGKEGKAAAGAGAGDLGGAVVPVVGEEKEEGGEPTDWFMSTPQSEVASAFTEEQRELFKKHFGGKFGNEDAEAFYKAHTENGARLAQLSQKEKQWEVRERNLASVNPMLARAIQLDLQGEDWRKELDTVQVDWRKEGSKQDERALLNAYQKGKVDEAEWEEYKSGDADEVTRDKVEKYVGMARDEYDRRRSQVMEAHKRTLDNEREAQKKWNNSVDEAIASTIRKFPNLKSELSDPKFRGELATGESINRLLFDEQGLLKSSAPLVVKIAQDPEGFLASVSRRIQYEAKKAAELAQLRNTPGQMRSRTGGDKSPTDPNTPKDPALQGLYEGLRKAGLNI